MSSKPQCSNDTVNTERTSASASSKPGNKKQNQHGSKARHGKQGNVQLDDGWTVVTKGFVQSSRLTPSPAKQEADDNEDDHLEQQVADLIQKYATFRRRFRETIYWLEVKFTLDNHPSQGIENAVCLALGSVKPTPNGILAGDLVTRTLWQLALFQEVVEHLSSKTRMAIPSYAQDPNFARLDKIFLQRLGLEVLETPGAVEKITPRSFLYVPFLTWHTLLLDVLPEKQPVLYLGSSVHAMVENLSGGFPPPADSTRELSEQDFESASAVGTTFLKDCLQIGLPSDFEHDGNAFHGLYLLRRQEDGAKLEAVSPEPG